MRLLHLAMCIALSACAASYGAEEAVRLKLRDGRTLEGIWDKWTGDFRMLGAPIKMTVKEADVLQTEPLDLELYDGKWLDPKKVKELKFTAAQIKKGLVEVDGQWITKEENDARIAKAKEEKDALIAKAKEAQQKAEAEKAAKAAFAGISDRDKAEIAEQRWILSVMMNRDLDLTGKTPRQINKEYRAAFFREEPQDVLDRLLVINDTLRERYVPLHAWLDSTIVMLRNEQRGSGAASIEVAEEVKAKAERAIIELVKPGVPLDKLWVMKNQRIGATPNGTTFTGDGVAASVYAISYLPLDCFITWDVAVTLPDGKPGIYHYARPGFSERTDAYYTFKTMSNDEAKNAGRIEMAKLGQYPMCHAIPICCGGYNEATIKQWGDLDLATRNQFVRNYQSDKSVYTFSPARIDWKIPPRLAKETKVANLFWTKATGTTIVPYVEKP